MGKFDFGKEEAIKSLKVFGWSVGSAVVALLISLVATVEFPPEFLFLAPIINTVLYSLKEFAADNTK